MIDKCVTKVLSLAEILVPHIQEQCIFLAQADFMSLNKIVIVFFVYIVFFVPLLFYLLLSALYFSFSCYLSLCIL